LPALYVSDALFDQLTHPSRVNFPFAFCDFDSSYGCLFEHGSSRDGRSQKMFDPSALKANREVYVSRLVGTHFKKDSGFETFGDMRCFVVIGRFGLTVPIEVKKGY